MPLRALTYDDLSVGAIRDMRRDQGAVLVRLGPRRGRALLRALRCRLELEEALLRDAVVSTLGTRYARVVLAELRLQLLHRRVWGVYPTLAALTSSPGWETGLSGDIVFGFIELKRAL